MHTLYRMTDIMLGEVIAINEVGALISASERLGSVLEQILRSEVRKLAINLMFPLLEKYDMLIV